MPPLYPQDPLTAVHRAAWRWLDVALAAGDVAGEVWALALIALALYSWLDREVRGVVKAFLPLAVALLVAVGLSLVGHAVLAVPRPVDAGGAGRLLRHAFPTGHAPAIAVFATYSLLAYGRRAVAALVVAVALAAARALSGPHWAAELAAGGVAGALVGAAAYAAALRLLPGGHLSRLRSARAARPAEVGAERPSA